MYRKILIIADIEGSSGCGNYRASSFNTHEWYDACIEMSLDIDSVVKAIFSAGAESVYIKDFHRTGYNLLPEIIDSRAEVIHGYKAGPVPGIGEVYDSEAAMFIGMHASSGSDGFLAHTFTSRYSSVRSGGRRLTELQLFASSLYSYSIKPVFFSGCPVACAEAEEDIPGITTFPVMKESSGIADIASVRRGIAGAAASSLHNSVPGPYILPPPFEIELTMRDGESAAERVSRKWGVARKGSSITITGKDFDDLYSRMIGVTYLTPMLEKITRVGLFLFNLFGRTGLSIVRIKKFRRISSLKRS